LTAKSIDERSNTMADEQSMTRSELVRRALVQEDGDFLKEAVAIVAAELMEAQITAEIGAELGEVAPEVRLTHRNGYRPRAWETRVGEVELLIPKKRSGARISRRFWNRGGVLSRRSSRLCWRRT
jgi:transposase-like protein